MGNNYYCSPSLRCYSHLSRRLFHAQNFHSGEIRNDPDLFHALCCLFHQLHILTTSILTANLRIRSFGVIWIRISDSRSRESWRIKGADESTLVADSSFPLINYDPSDLG